MAYTKGTLARVFEKRAPNMMLASRLVELGVMESGLYGIERSFGSTPKTFRAKDFSRFAESISEQEIKDGGLGRGKASLAAHRTADALTEVANPDLPFVTALLTTSRRRLSRLCRS
jgi:hypothetical protein